MAAVRLKHRVLFPFGLACVFLFVLSLAGIYLEEEEHVEEDVLRSAGAMKQSYDALLSKSAEKLIAAIDN